MRPHRERDDAAVRDERNREQFATTSHCVEGAEHDIRAMVRAMVVVGSLQLLAFGFRANAPLPRHVLETLDQVQRHGTLRVLDAIYVSRTKSGSFVVDNASADLINVPSDVSPLLQLLGDNSLELDIAPALQLCSSSEVGFDLLDAENFESPRRCPAHQFSCFSSKPPG